MEKRIKIEIDKIKNKTIKIGKNKIEVKPYISTRHLAGITDICLQQLENADSFINFGMIKTIFDMLVVNSCTNILVNGINTKESKDEYNVYTDLDLKKISDFEQNAYIYYIKKHILNYEESYKSVLKAIELKNLFNAFNIFAKNIPDVEQMGESLKIAFENIKELKEKDPETFDRVVKETINKQAREEGKKEYLENKKLEKNDIVSISNK